MTRGASGPGCCDLAPLYALGGLDGDDLWRFRGHLLAGCDACIEELADLACVTRLLATAAAPARPPTTLRRELLARVAAPPANVPGAVVPRTSAPHEPELPDEDGWKPHAIPGISTRRLFVDAETREVVMVVKAAAGASYPRHRHARVEEMYMLEGELKIGSVRYQAGDYIRSRPGSAHEPSETRVGCSFLLRASLDDEFLF